MMLGSIRICRTFRTATVCLKSRTSRRRSNPGMGHQITAFEDDVTSEMQENPEGFGDLESDFADVHKSHKQYELEHQKQAQRIRQFVVKSKYFQDSKLPNFLTHAEKDQIRFLHGKDAEQWSVEVLAESFPANCEIIRKLLKANWKPLSEKRIQAHDAAVSRNWQLFRKGELGVNLPEELKNHLNQFSQRQIEKPQTPVNLTNTYQKKAPMSNEFSSIVAKYPKKENRSDELKEISPRNVNHTEEEDTFMLDKVRNKKNIRLQELKSANPALQVISPSAEKLIDHQIDVDYKASSISGTAIVEDLSSKFSQKFSLNEVAISDEDRRRFEMTAVKDRIHIPRKKLRPGAIYRVDDSYYDDDGEFLYRVPGMTGG